MSLFEKHVFVCVSGKICPDQNSLAVFETLKQAIQEQGLKTSIRINKSGCLAQCGNGPMVVVYPEGTWYAGVKVSDCHAIVHSHLINGQIVTKLLYHPPEQQPA